jgi:hypothetical protein
VIGYLYFLQVAGAMAAVWLVVSAIRRRPPIECPPLGVDISPLLPKPAAQEGER